MIKEDFLEEDLNAGKQKYTMKNLKDILEKVLKYSNESNESNKLKLLENIRSLTVFLIWGDKNNDDFFDFFCENAILDTLFTIMKKTKFKEITIEIIQSLGMFLSNIQKQTCLIYILSNNVINEFISYNFNFLDEEIVAFFITFLKSLSLRLSSIPIQLFYNEKFNTFPLISQAVRFFNHKDNLVRTSVRSITLTVFANSKKDPKLIQFLIRFPFVLYFVHLSCYMKDLWIKIDQIILESNYHKYTQMKDMMGDLIDLFKYLEDLYDLEVEEINNILSNALLSYAIFPCIFKSLSGIKKGAISLNLAIFLIFQIFKNLNYSPLLDIILLYLFGYYIDKRILILISNPIKPPCSYSFKWSFSNFWDDYPDLVAKHAEIQFIRKHKSSDDLGVDTPLKNEKIHEIEKKNKGEDLKSKHDSSIQITKNDGQKKLTSNSSNYLDFRNYFKSDILKYESEHRRISKALGFLTIEKLHDSEEILQKSPMDLSKETFGKLMNYVGILKEGAESADLQTKSEEFSHNFEKNEFREILFSFLRSKDDNLILLIVSLLFTIVTKDHIKKPEVLLFCGLMKPKNCKLFEGNKFNFQSISFITHSCLKLLKMDPPFRVYTFKLLAKLIMELTKINEIDTILKKEDIILFNEAQKMSIQRMNNLFKNAIIAEFMVENFENEWKLTKKKNFLKTNLEVTYQMFLPVPTENINNLDFEMRYPAGDFETTRRDIALFFLFRDIRYTIDKRSKFKQNETDIDQLYVDFNKNISSKWETGKSYEIDQRKLYPCNLKNKKDFCYIVEDNNNFILIETDISNTKQNWAKIIYNVSLKNIEAVIDRSEPLILIVGIKDIPTNSKEKYIDLILKFDDHTLSLAVKKTLDDNRKLSKQFELSLLIKVLDYTEQDMIPL